MGGWEGDGRQGGMDRFLHRPTERTGGLTKIEIGQGDGGIWGGGSTGELCNPMKLPRAL